MPEENNNQQKSQYLKREEVRTMEKDIARLRESEAETAREKIAELKTEEEAAKEAQRLEQLGAAAEEREKMESEDKRKQEELERLKSEEEQRIASAKALSAKGEEIQKETIRSQLKEAQTKEEEERRKFLENVSAKAEGRAVEEKPYIPFPLSAPEPPIPPSVPTPDVGTIPPSVPTPDVGIAKKPFEFPKVKLPKVPVPKIEGYFPEKSSLFEKIWIRIVVSLFVIAILASLATFWYWYLAIRQKPAATPAPITPAPTVIIPETIEKQREIIQRLIETGYYSPSASRIIDAIIIHSDSGASDNPYGIENIIGLYKTANVATHYLISRDGTIYQLVPDTAIAYHAGAGRMPDGRGNVNNFSVGIGLVYQESENPNNDQYESLSWLIKKLREKYDIATENILGYKDIAPAKTTPWNFDWDEFKL